MENMVNTILLGTENYFVISVVIVCFITGYVIRNHTKLDNKYIPLLMIAVGMIANTADTVMGGDMATLGTLVSGAVSGLASSGFYDLLAKSFGLMGNNSSNSSDSHKE